LAATQLVNPEESLRNGAGVAGWAEKPSPLLPQCTEKIRECSNMHLKGPSSE